MKIFLRHFFLIVFIICSFISFSQNDFNDSIQKFTPQKINSLIHLDSLRNLWFVQNSLKNQKVETTDFFIEFSDEEYQQRFREIEKTIPLSYNKKVEYFIEIYLKDKREELEIMIGMFDYYEPKFENILKEKNLPEELKYFPLIKSALNPAAVSESGASGMWQFTYPTAKYYGLHIDSYIDERRDYLKSSDAAADVLQNLYEIYNDWILALAAYNCGPGNINKAIRRSNGKTDFWKIYNYLPAETRDFVPAFFAINYVMHYYPEYKIKPAKINLLSKADTVEITKKLHLKQLAEVLQLHVQQIREMNPIFKLDVIPENGRKHFLALPLSYGQKFIELQDSIYSYKDSLFFNISKPIIVKTYTKQKSYYKPKKPSENSAEIYYTIKSGDNLGYISSWYNVSVNDLTYWNGLYSNFIKAGQKLVIYVPKSKVDYYKKINSLSFEKKQKLVGKAISQPSKPKNKTKQSSTSGSGWIYYTIKSGDSPYSIAKKYNGVSEDDIMKLNNISNPRNLKVGQKLKIKRK